MVGVAWLSTLTFLAAFADWLPFVRYHDQKVVIDQVTQNRYRLGPSRDAWFGTDSLGFDVFAQCIYGARGSLVVGVGATVVGLSVGGLLGISAGYFRGRTDRIVSVVIDSLLAMPALLLAMLVVFRVDDLKSRWDWLSWFGRTWQITFALGLLSVAPIARIVRAQTFALRDQEFVLAARSLGANRGRILTREILPNLVPAMITVAFTGLGILIAAEGALAFLGLGIEDPSTWGKLIDTNRNRLDEAWWATIFPALMLFGTVVAFNLIGDELARRFDVREAAV